MRWMAFLCGIAVLILAIITAGFRAAAARTSAENEQLERQLAQLSRVRDVEADTVSRMRQPFSIARRLDWIPSTAAEKTKPKTNSQITQASPKTAKAKPESDKKKKPAVSTPGKNTKNSEALRKPRSKPEASL